MNHHFHKNDFVQSAICNSLELSPYYCLTAVSVSDDGILYTFPVDKISVQLKLQHIHLPLTRHPDHLS